MKIISDVDSMFESIITHNNLFINEAII